jgi:hypothetical protein
MLQHQFTLAGEANLTAAALDQFAIEVTFQRLNATAERRLAEVDRFRRAAKIAVVGEGHEVAKLA